MQLTRYLALIFEGRPDYRYLALIFEGRADYRYLAHTSSKVVQLTRYLAHVFVGEVGLSGPGEGGIFRGAGEDPLQATTASDLSRKRERLQTPSKFSGSKLHDVLM